MLGDLSLFCISCDPAGSLHCPLQLWWQGCSAWQCSFWRSVCVKGRAAGLHGSRNESLQRVHLVACAGAAVKQYSYNAFGAFGQRVFIVPEKELMILHFGLASGGVGDGYLCNTQVANYIIGKITKAIT